MITLNSVYKSSSLTLCQETSLHTEGNKGINQKLYTEETTKMGILIPICNFLRAFKFIWL